MKICEGHKIFVAIPSI